MTSNPRSETDARGAAETSVTLPDRALDSATEPNSKLVKVERARVSNPLVAENAFDQISWEQSTVEARSSWHERAARKWEFVAKLTALIVALSAAISALTVFADNRVASIVFSLITAAISAVNASFDPPGTAKNHRQAARKYERIVRPLSELAYRLQPQEGATIAPQDLAGVWDAFIQYRQQIEEINETAPSANWSRVIRSELRREAEYRRLQELVRSEQRTAPG